MVELGESNVSLKEEDITRRPKEFQQTFFEFISREGIQIIIHGGTTTNATIYTVPNNKEFHLFNIVVTISGDGAGAGGSYSVTKQGTSIILYQINLPSNSTDLISQSISYPIPIKFESNENIRIDGQATGPINVIIFGIELSKEIAFRR